MQRTKLVFIVVTSHGSLGNTGLPTGCHLGEVAQAYLALEEAGLDVQLASIQGGAAPFVDATEEGRLREFVERPDIQAVLRNTQSLDLFDASECDAVYFAGGLGAMWDFPRDPAVLDFTSALYERGGVIAAIGHGAAALVNVRLADGRFLLEGMRVTATTNEEERSTGTAQIVPFSLEETLIRRGARFTHTASFEKNLVISGNLITGQNAASALATAQALVTSLSAGRSS